MRKTLKYLIIAFIMSCLIAQDVYAVDVTKVCDQCTYKTIREAVEASKEGDVIKVLPGIYKEHDLEIDIPLTLIGMGWPVIDGEEIGSIIKVSAKSVKISGFILKNVGFSHTNDYAAIHILNSQDFEITENIMQNVFFGILVERSRDGRISNNQISGNFEKEFYSGNGIHGWNSSFLRIEENNLFGLRDGIYLEFVDESLIIGNVSQNNIRYGLHFMFSNHDRYELNEFSNNGAGVAVMFSKFIAMKKNRFYKNWGPASFGLLLKEIYDAEITDNEFYHNTTAIRVDGSSRILYERNDFRENGWAIKVAGGCYTNTFKQNNFLYNSFDLSYNSRMNDNLFEENYWSSYTGYDLNNDGIGDVPYRPVKLFSYIVNRTPETVILLRSLFTDILNFSENVSPVFTPDDLMDPYPLMNKVTSYD
ncbi:nitrous oxide reductase family maturation protein NosD [Balneola sp. MJW-20]|uniref:nitrous oxide reductase family maturation protein NosD n=1 Tax=Gracilimonas aurantiaca TaxID=3234185 RepID=UPI003465FBF7